MGYYFSHPRLPTLLPSHPRHWIRAIGHHLSPV